MNPDRLARVLNTPYARKSRVYRRLDVNHCGWAVPLKRLIVAPVVLNPIVSMADHLEVSQSRRTKPALQHADRSELSEAERTGLMPMKLRAVVVAPDMREAARAQRHYNFEMALRSMRALKECRDALR